MDPRSSFLVNGELLFLKADCGLPHVPLSQASRLLDSNFFVALYAVFRSFIVISMGIYLLICKLPQWRQSNRRWYTVAQPFSRSLPSYFSWFFFLKWGTTGLVLHIGEPMWQHLAICEQITYFRCWSSQVGYQLAQGRNYLLRFCGGFLHIVEFCDTILLNSLAFRHDMSVTLNTINFPQLG